MSARLDQTGAERIDDDDLVVAHGLDKPGDAEAGGSVEFERIGEIGIDPAQQHFGAPQPRDGADKDAVIPYDQILAVHQKKPEIARQIGVLEIGLVHRPRREQTDARVILAIEREQLRLERLKERRNALDPRGAVDVGDGARQREPVLDRVARARRRLRPIVEHPPPAVGAAPHVNGIEPQVRAARRRNADQRPQIFRIAGDQGGRQAALAGERCRAVAIRQHGFQQFGALGEPGLKLLPFRQARSGAGCD